MRNRTKKVDVSKESMQELMQEVYNEVNDQRKKALNAYKLYSREIEDSSDISLIGKVCNDLLKINDMALEKKMKLIKMQLDVLYKNDKTSDSQGSDNSVITDADKAWIRKQLEQSDIGLDEKDYN